MGQYWYPVNLDKKEFIHPHKLGCGLKLWEQMANHPGTAVALVILLAKQGTARGGGDPDMGGEDGYDAIAERTIGRWAGDRIAVVGDYGSDGIYERCSVHYEPAEDRFTDISDDVAAVIEHELRGKFSGSGWRDWKYDE